MTDAQARLTLRILGEQDTAAWDEALRHSSQGTALQWLPLMRTIGNSMGGSETIGIERDGELVAGLIGFDFRQDGKRLLRTLPLTAYHGLWLRDEGLTVAQSQELMEAVAEVLVPNLNDRYDDWAFACAPEIQCSQPFENLGCQVSPHYTYRMDLDEPDEMMARFESEARRQIRRAGKSGFVTEVCDPTAEQLEVFNAIMMGVSHRVDADHHWPEGVFGEMARVVTERDLGKLFITRDADGKPIASALTLWDRYRVYGLLGGSERSKAGVGAMRLVNWDSFVWLWEQGHREIDLCGGNLPGIVQFKREWNSRLVSYLTIGRSAKPSRMASLRMAAREAIKFFRG